nr:reverse transcriptase domain-containing protein [Tanacetum cinerariifolium]
MPASDAALREYCDRNYYQLLPVIAEKVHQEKVQQERLKAVKARPNFEETSQHSELGTPSRRRDLKKRLGSRHARGMSESPESRRDHSKSPRKKDLERRKTFKRLEKCVFHRLGDKGKTLLESEGSAGGHWKSNPKRQKSSVKDDLFQPWVCEETDSFTPRIRYFDFLKTQMPSHIKTYNGSEDPEDHLKIFQAKKCIKDPVEIHNISREMENPRTSSCGGKLLKPTKAGAKVGHIHPPHKSTKRNSGFGHKEVQASSANDNPGKKRNASKFYEFHGKVGHTTDECMHLKRKIKEMFKAGKLLHLIKELKQSNGKDQEKAAKKEETLGKEKPLAIQMEDGTEGPMIIEAEMRGHFVHRMYVDGGSSSEILYEHCFNRFRPEVRSQMVLATTSLIGFSGEIIWPIRQTSLLVKIGDEEHSTSAWMNFMVVRSPSPYNGIIKRP